MRGQNHTAGSWTDGQSGGTVTLRVETGRSPGGTANTGDRLGSLSLMIFWSGSGSWRDVESQLTGELGAQETGRLVQPQARLTVYPATLPAPPEDRAGATAGPAAASPVHRVVHQQEVEGRHGLARNGADPACGATSGLHHLHQDPAQHSAQVLVAGLVSAGTPIGTVDCPRAHGVWHGATEPNPALVPERRWP